MTLTIGRAPDTYDPIWFDMILGQLRMHMEPPNPGRYQRVTLGSDHRVWPLLTTWDADYLLRRATIFFDDLPDPAGGYVTRFWLRNLDTGRMVMPGDTWWTPADISKPLVPYVMASAENIGIGAADLAIIRVGQTLALEWDHMTPGTGLTPSVPASEREVTTEDPPEEAGAPIGTCWIKVDVEMAR